MVRTRFDKSIKTIRTDNETEFKAKFLNQLYDELGILHPTSCIDTPQQNGRIEQKDKTHFECNESASLQANLPIK